LTVAVEEPDELAIGDRRGEAKFSLVDPDAGTGLVLPEDFAVGAIEAYRWSVPACWSTVLTKTRSFQMAGWQLKVREDSRPIHVLCFEKVAGIPCPRWSR